MSSPRREFSPPVRPRDVLIVISLARIKVILVVNKSTSASAGLVLGGAGLELGDGCLSVPNFPESEEIRRDIEQAVAAHFNALHMRIEDRSQCFLVPGQCFLCIP